MEVGQISPPVRSAGGFHIVKLLDKKTSEKKHIVRQTLARHILIQTNAITSSAQAKQRITRIWQRIQAGEDFAQLARASSDDSGSAAKGGSLGWVNPGTMVSEFEEQMQALKPGEISKPFQTRFGWHIVQVLSRRDYDNTGEYLRNQARNQIRQRKITEETQIWLRQLKDDAYVEYRLEQ
jgi:peptidyl-prolyl cis-trans isomerase SurA